jgi:phosphoenolpyruvate-protein kinase (PTS system EI component)
VALAVEAAHAAGISCAVCGELAGDAAAAPLLVGLGVDALSVAPAKIAEIREILARRDHGELSRLALQATAAESALALAALLERSG